MRKFGEAARMFDRKSETRKLQTKSGADNTIVVNLHLHTSSVFGCDAFVVFHTPQFCVPDCDARSGSVRMLSIWRSRGAAVLRPAPMGTCGWSPLAGLVATFAGAKAAKIRV